VGRRQLAEACAEPFCGRAVFAGHSPKDLGLQVCSALLPCAAPSRLGYTGGSQGDARRMGYLDLAGC
jgi:hypothetical protein